jgi:serine kinase of HPr protein (carbohydrate metabolism regulator)
VSDLPDPTVHASCVAIGGRAVLIAGPSGSGKSDLALRLIDRGASLVSDDYTQLRRDEGRLIASAPARIAGRMEVRGVGIVNMAATAEAQVCLLVELAGASERMPEARTVELAGMPIPVIALAALEASAPLKVEYALKHFGLPLS